MAGEIRNERAPMQYRRFGKTERALSVITLGGMRYPRQGEKPRTDVPREMLDNCIDCTVRALDAGINHIETAWAYGKSESCYGITLSEELKIPRSRYHLMTKGHPQTAEDVRKMVDRQLQSLRTDHIDLYAVHGLGSRAAFRRALSPGGPVDELYKLREQGMIGEIGFSTHCQDPKILIEALDSDRFSFINLHYYYFWQLHADVVAHAAKKDLGVFIISPNDKGGRLYEPLPELRDMTAPATPIQFNARWCLSDPAVHTLSFGMTAPEHFDEMRGILPVSAPLSEADARIRARLEARLDEVPHARYEGYADYPPGADPSGINIAEVLRLRRLWRCFGMIGFAKFRYNMFSGSQALWYPGELATDEAIAKVDVSRAPDGIPLADLLRDAHQGLYEPRE
ncbi:MAG: aldo/keto reductase [Myxococcales bacterium]|nr:aldo/keto reductase [Myxococcales bacterium]